MLMGAVGDPVGEGGEAHPEPWAASGGEHERERELGASAQSSSAAGPVATAARSRRAASP